MTKLIFEKKLLLSLISLQCLVKAQWESDPIQECAHLGKNGEYFCLNYASLKNFTNPEKIEFLTILEINKAGILKAGVLFSTNLVNLQSMLLMGAKKIEVGAFKGGVKLNYLNLATSLFEELDLKVFEDLPNLNTLRMSGQIELKGLLDDAEFPRMNLTFLKLRSFEMKSLPSNLFKNLENLTTLHLQDNRLKTLDWNVFKPLKHLKEAYLSFDQFHCDCHSKFLLDFFDKKNVTWSLIAPNCSYNEYILIKRWNQLDRKVLTCAPKLMSLNMSHSKTIKDSVLLECEYSGYPVPNVTWTLNGEILTLENSTTIQNKALDSLEEFPELGYKFKQTLSIPLSSIPNSVRNDTNGNNFTCIGHSNVGNANESISVDLNTTTLSSSLNDLNNATSNPLNENVAKGEPKSNFGTEIVFVIVLETIVGVAVFIAFRYSRKILAIFTKQRSGTEQEARANFEVSVDEATSVTGLIADEL